MGEQKYNTPFDYIIDYINRKIEYNRVRLIKGQFNQYSTWKKFKNDFVYWYHCEREKKKEDDDKTED